MRPRTFLEGVWGGPGTLVPWPYSFWRRFPIRFYLTAVGSASQAQTTFTDSTASSDQNASGTGSASGGTVSVIGTGATQHAKYYTNQVPANDPPVDYYFDQTLYNTLAILNGVVVVTDDKIVAVGRQGAVQVPAGARTIELAISVGGHRQRASIVTACCRP